MPQNMWNLGVKMAKLAIFEMSPARRGAARHFHPTPSGKNKKGFKIILVYF